MNLYYISLFLPQVVNVWNWVIIPGKFLMILTGFYVMRTGKTDVKTVAALAATSILGSLNLGRIGPIVALTFTGTIIWLVKLFDGGEENE